MSKPINIYIYTYMYILYSHCIDLALDSPDIALPNLNACRPEKCIHMHCIHMSCTHDVMHACAHPESYRRHRLPVPYVTVPRGCHRPLHVVPTRTVSTDAGALCDGAMGWQLSFVLIIGHTFARHMLWELVIP